MPTQQSVALAVLVQLEDKRGKMNISRQEKRAQERQKNTKNNIPTMVLAVCPKCEQRRLTKYVDENGKHEPVSYAKITVRGEDRFIDICGHCNENYRKQDQLYVMKNLKKLQQAIMNRDSDNTSDKDFSIDL